MPGGHEEEDGRMGKCDESKTRLYLSRGLTGSKVLMIAPATHRLLDDVNNKLSQTIDGIKLECSEFSVHTTDARSR